MGYVELHGTVVACVTAGQAAGLQVQAFASQADLPSDVFSNVEVALTAPWTQQGAAAAVRSRRSPPPELGALWQRPAVRRPTSLTRLSSGSSRGHVRRRRRLKQKKMSKKCIPWPFGTQLFLIWRVVYGDMSWEEDQACQ